MSPNLIEPLQLRIRPSAGGGYFIEAKYETIGWWPESFCLTLWGAQWKAHRIRQRFTRHLLNESIPA